MQMAGPIDVWVPTHSMMGQQEHPPNLAGDCVAPGDAHTNTPFMPTFTLFGAPSNELTADPEFVPPPSAVDGLGGSKRLGSRQHSQHPATIPQESEAEDTQADALAAWVASIIANNGGVITSASLGSTLSSEHQSLYRVIKTQYNGLCALLSRYPTRFILADNPPSNHVVLVPGPGLPSHQLPPQQAQQRGGKGSRSLKSGGVGFHGKSNNNGIDGRSASSHEQPWLRDDRRSPHGQPADRARRQDNPSRRDRWPATALFAPESGQPSEAPSSGKSGSSSSSSSSSDGSSSSPSLESTVVQQTILILQDASSHSLKAVELANTLRARMGTDALASVRSRFGGLLTLLDRHPTCFHVQRIPKADSVALCYAYTKAASSAPPPQSQQLHQQYQHPLQPQPQVQPFQQHHPQQQPQHQRQQDHQQHPFQQQLQQPYFQQPTQPPSPTQLYQGVQLHQAPYFSANSTGPLSESPAWAPPSHAHAMPREWKPGCEWTPLSNGASPSVSPPLMAGTSSPLPPPPLPSPPSPPPLHSSQFRHPLYRSSFDSASSSGSNGSGNSSSIVGNGSFLGPSWLDANKTRSNSYDSFASSSSSQHDTTEAAFSPFLTPAGAGGGAALTSTSLSHGFSSGGGGNQPPASGSSGSSGKGNSLGEVGVLELLTTERCVPTQAWPMQHSRDEPVVRALCQLLMELGGGCTISKLRSVLKLRLGATESVKSVPLKAFLTAYGSYFAMSQNRVTLSRVL